MSEDLIAAHRDVPKLMPYLHLPFQSGSDRILAAMNRKHTRRGLSARLSGASAPPVPTSRCPPTSSSAFPARRSRLRGHARGGGAVGFAQAYSFKYSPRPGTPGAHACGDQVPERSRSSGCSACRACSSGNKQRSIRPASGRSCRCLFERRGAIRASSSAARPTCKPSMRKASRSIGRIVEVEIAGAGPNSLRRLIWTAGVAA